MSQLIKLNADEDPFASPTIIKFIYYRVRGERMTVPLSPVHMLRQ